MKPSLKRPASVWTALVILALYISLFILGLIVGPPDPSVLDTPPTDEIIIGIAETVAMTISLAIALWALATRRQWGRWFVAGMIAYVFGASAYDHFFLPELDASGQDDYLLHMSIGFTPLLLVVILVSFGEGVRKYFSAVSDK